MLARGREPPCAVTSCCTAPPDEGSVVQGHHKGIELFSPLPRVQPGSGVVQVVMQAVQVLVVQVMQVVQVQHLRKAPPRKARTKFYQIVPKR